VSRYTSLMNQQAIATKSKEQKVEYNLNFNNCQLTRGQHEHFGNSYCPSVVEGGWQHDRRGVVSEGDETDKPLLVFDSEMRDGIMVCVPTCSFFASKLTVIAGVSWFFKDRDWRWAARDWLRPSSPTGIIKTGLKTEGKLVDLF